MRRFALTTVLTGVLLSAGCSGSETSSGDLIGPSKATAPGLASSADVACVPVSLSNLRSQLAALATGSTLSAANKKLDDVVAFLAAHKTIDAQEKAVGLVAQITDKFYAGFLTGGTSDATKSKLATLINNLYCFTGMSSLNISPDAFGPNGKVLIVGPSSPETKVVTDSKLAGIVIPAGAAPRTVTVVFYQLPSFPGPLNTGPGQGQYPLFYEYSVSPAVAFNTSVQVGICTSGSPNLSNLVLAHNVGAGLEELEPASSTGAAYFAANLAPGCTGSDAQLIGSGGRNGTASFAFRTWMGLAHRLAPVASLLLPETLSAASSTLAACCLSGGTKTFSPFGAVDRLQRLPLSYGSTAFRYAVGAGGSQTGFEARAYPETGWTSGDAAFGSVPELAASGCSDALTSRIKTRWAPGSGEVPSHLFTRRSFYLESVPAGGVNIGVAIDNDIGAAYVNGQQVGQGFVHEGCATDDSFIYPVGAAQLRNGMNYFAIDAVDRGGATFFDVSVTANVAAAPQ